MYFDQSENYFCIGYVNNDNEESFVVLNGTDASMAGSYYNQSTPQTATVVRGVGPTPKPKTVFMMSTYTTGYFFRVFDLGTFSFMSFYGDTSKEIYTAKFMYGYLLLSQQQTGNYYVSMVKLVLDDTAFEGQVLNPTTQDLQVDGGVSSFSSSTATATDDTFSRSVTDDTYTPGSLGTYTLSNNMTSLLNYLNASYSTIYLPSGSSTTNDYTSPCLLNASLSLSAQIGDNFYGESSPDWVKINEDLDKLTLDVPTISENTTEYYIGIDYSYATYTYTQYNTLLVFKCHVSNCKT